MQQGSVADKVVREAELLKLRLRPDLRAVLAETEELNARLAGTKRSYDDCLFLIASLTVLMLRSTNTGGVRVTFNSTS